MYVLEEFRSQVKVWLDMKNSLQVRIVILSKEVGCLFWVLFLCVNHPQSNSYSFRKMFIIGQNSKHVHVTCFSKNFDLLLINSSRYLSLIFHFIKEMLYVNTYYEWWNKTWRIYTFTCLRCWRILFFFNPKLKIHYQNFLTELSFIMES